MRTVTDHAAEADVVWTEEELRQLRQDALAGREAVKGTDAQDVETPRRNEAEFWQPILMGRDLSTLLWGIVREDLTPEERKIWDLDGPPAGR